jgi:CRISPR/Cas system endoribonuclease Cas6 (RAMP superfamily)
MPGSRLFRYELPRHSYRQGKWMNFDGVVGWIEWEGELDSVLPWLRAAELLHVGQKATFGMGKLELHEL